METMTQKDKELLLKDLCARLPYDIKVEYKGEEYDVLGIAHGRLVLCKPLMSYTLNENPLIKEVKPYLFPLSSMTEEKIEELLDIVIPTNNGSGVIEESNIGKYMDWCNKNNFDYRGLIEKGLAIDATGKNIY